VITFFQFLILALAASAAVDLWFNGSILAGARARVEASEGLVAELLGCPFCLTHWAAAAVLALFVLPGTYFPAFMWPAYALAAARLGWIVNGLLPARLRFEAGKSGERR
jgi:hypothetical protein